MVMVKCMISIRSDVVSGQLQLCRRGSSWTHWTHSDAQTTSNNQHQPTFWRSLFPMRLHTDRRRSVQKFRYGCLHLPAETKQWSLDSPWLSGKIVLVYASIIPYINIMICPWKISENQWYFRVLKMQDQNQARANMAHGGNKFLARRKHRQRSWNSSHLRCIKRLSLKQMRSALCSQGTWIGRSLGVLQRNCVQVPSRFSCLFLWQWLKIQAPARYHNSSGSFCLRNIHST